MLFPDRRHELVWDKRDKPRGQKRGAHSSWPQWEDEDSMKAGRVLFNVGVPLVLFYLFFHVLNGDFLLISMNLWWFHPINPRSKHGSWCLSPASHREKPVHWMATTLNRHPIEKSSRKSILDMSPFVRSKTVQSA